MKIQFYKSKKNKQWYWRAKARNGRKVAGGAEGYKSKAMCIKGFKALLKVINSGNIEIESTTNTNVRKDKASKE
jgi:uncharacterized protein YegP (UPF0339 family)